LFIHLKEYLPRSGYPLLERGNIVRGIEQKRLPELGGINQWEKLAQDSQPRVQIKGWTVILRSLVLTITGKIAAWKEESARGEYK